MTKQELEQEIKQANIAYASGIPYMTDAEYDVLWQQLYAIDPDNELLYHTAQDRGALTGLVKHKRPIYGTNKAFNMEDLKPFLTRFGSKPLVIEPKYDGCAAVITHEKDGISITLEGDGRCGKDITHMMKYIKFPFHLRNFQAVEILLPWEDWNPNYGKNPRNVVAGWLSRKYDAPATTMTAIPHNFGNLSHDYFYDGDIESLNELLLTIYNKWSVIYPIDGLMIKVADEKLRLVAGNNGVTNAWSIAWKPPIQVKETKVVNIEWNVSRLGRVIPTVIYEPIELCGTTNSRVTGNNAKWLAVKNIQIGSFITVGKAGEIIPKIISVEKNKNEFKLPAVCPTCGELLHVNGVHLICNGDNCIAKKIVSIAYFYSGKGIKVNGIGEKIIEKLLRNKKCYDILIEKPWALLDCLSYDILDEVISVIGPATLSNIIEQIQAVNGEKNMAHFIAGLGLHSVAYKTALRLCQYLKTGILTMHVHKNAKKNFSIGVFEFEKASKEMKNFHFAKLPNPAKAIYCITGVLSQSRNEMIEWLAQQGYEFSAGVTRATNYLIVGENPGKTKIQKAERYDIPQITEEQLLHILGEKK